MYYVYILGNDRPTLYIGVTSNLIRRVQEHRDDVVEGFTKKYNLKKLLYYESCPDIGEALLREKRLKKWRRAWKIELIQTINPSFRDLAEDF